MLVKYKEIFKLKVMLDNANIPYEFYDNSINTYPKDPKPWVHFQIIVKKKNSNDRLISVIEGLGTYGEKEDKLEIMGCLTDQEKAEDAVLGYLTADQVFSRIEKNYK